MGDGSELEIADSILDLIGNTPMVRLPRLSESQGLVATLAVKLETTNPGGSVKDRPAVAMVDAAERAGLLRPGGTIVEPTSGNTGVGLAIVAAQRGYKCVFVMTDKVAPEKIAFLRGVRGRGRRLPGRRLSRRPAVVLLHRGAARPRDPRRVPAEPIRQPCEPAVTRRHDRP